MYLRKIPIIILTDFQSFLFINNMYVIESNFVERLFLVYNHYSLFLAFFQLGDQFKNTNFTSIPDKNTKILLPSGLFINLPYLSVTRAITS